MSDSFGSAWALGSIAGELSAQRNAQTTQYFVDAMRRRRERQQQGQQVQVDVGALLQHLEEREAYIEGLEAEIAELRRQGAIVAANRDKIDKWATWAQEKLISAGLL